MFGRRQQGIRKRGGPAIVMLGDIRKGAGIILCNRIKICYLSMTQLNIADLRYWGAVEDL